MVRFRGQSDVPVLPTLPPDRGSALLWANAKDSIDTRLTREVDLTGATDAALAFKTWYDIEPWFDWGYVSASTDGGKTWRALTGDHTTAEDPVQTSYGAGYTGVSGDGQTPAWIDERVSLAQYAGKRILLRFEYVTDGSTHGEGWAIDDLNVTGANLDDADGSFPGWTSEGWVRIDKPLPQTYIVRVIEKRTNGDAAVVDVPVDARGQSELRFSADGIQEATLAVAGSTEGTNQPAPYHVELARG